MIPNTMTSSRRRFLACSAAVATAKFPILGANDRVNIGVVGLGGRGQKHIEFYQKWDADARIAAVCDVNQASRERTVTAIEKAKGNKPTEFAEMRQMFESKDVEAVSIATPNHWHALAGIWACQAGKDVYLEKPASHNVYEGTQLVNAARKYKRMVQIGSQSRSTPHKMAAIALLHQGAIGQVYSARGLCYRRRFSIGHTPDQPVPAGLDWSGFLGPAQWKPFSKNRFAYTWHWFWDTGNGDIGNQGVHEMDISLWGMQYTGNPDSVVSTGGKYVWQDDQETPNTQSAHFRFSSGADMTFEVRNLPTPPEALAAFTGPNWVGNIFFGSEGFLVLDQRGYQIYKSTAKVTPEQAQSMVAGGMEKYEKTAEGKANPGEESFAHVKNFLDCVKSRDYQKLNADVEIGVRSAAYCHYANIAYRIGRTLKIAAHDGTFLSDPEASTHLTRQYRSGYTVPETKL
jgi:predicted dehydrogenase